MSKNKKQKHKKAKSPEEIRAIKRKKLFLKYYHELKSKREELRKEFLFGRVLTYHH